MTPLTLTVDLNDLTLGELADFEDAAGADAVDQLIGASKTGKGEQPRMSAKTMVALVWIMQRRTDPSFTLEQARAVKVTELAVDTPKKNGRAKASAGAS